MRFSDRKQAGEKLARLLTRYCNKKETIIYALPRGGVVIGLQVARFLNAPLHLIITRKIGHPRQPEYAIAAVAEDGHFVGNKEEIEKLSTAWFKNRKQMEQNEVKRRHNLYLKKKKPLSARGKIAIVVDDGIATGLTIEAAIFELKHQKPKRIIIAIPVIPQDTAKKLQKQVDELVAIDIPSVYLGAVGAYYDNFPEVTDTEVIKLFTSQ